VRRRLIPPKHLNHDAIEDADRRHKIKTNRPLDGMFSGYYAGTGFTNPCRST
jgi:hypothetical protein